MCNLQCWNFITTPFTCVIPCLRLTMQLKLCNVVPDNYGVFGVKRVRVMMPRAHVSDPVFFRVFPFLFWQANLKQTTPLPFSPDLVNESISATVSCITHILLNKSLNHT